MKRLNQILYFLFLFLWPYAQNSYAQTLQIKFNLVEGTDGVSLGKINGITQDTKGYMWFADQDKKCITRYDGYKMISYSNDSLNPNSLGGTYPECILADSSGIIWIGFLGTGLDRFDPETDSFTHFRNIKNDPSSLSSDNVLQILMDRHGLLWIGTDAGLNCFDQRTGKFKLYRHDVNDPGSLSNNMVRAIYEDREGELWIGTGFPWEIDGKGGLNRFEKKTGTFIRYLNDPKDPHSLINNKVRAIFEDSRGIFWVGTAGDGLHTMDRKKGTFERHLYHASRPEQLSRPPIKKGNIEDHITFITEDSTGAIWIGTWQAGLNRYDPITKKITHYSYLDKMSGFTDNTGWCAYTSRDGVLWISTEEANLYRLNPLQKNVTHVEVNSRVYAFYEDTSGTLWLGTSEGLIQYNRNKKIVKRFANNNLTESTNYGLFEFYEDSKANLWIVRYNRLFIFNTKTQTFSQLKNYTTQNSVIWGHRDILTILEDRQGSFWIGAWSGLYKMNRQSDSLTRYNYRNEPKDRGLNPCCAVASLIEDRQGDIWAGTLFEGGIVRFNSNTGKFKYYLEGTGINCIYEDADGILWAGTVNGLFRRHRGSDVFSLYSDPGSSIGIAEVVRIVEDDEKNLWVSTKSGIFGLDRQRNQVLVIGPNQGVKTSTLSQAIYKLKSGELLFGAATGYYAFFPNQLIKNNKPPELVIRDFRISNQLVKPGKIEGLKLPLDRTNEIKLNYNQNTFSFDFAGIHYSNPDQNSHFFMLEGHEDSWQNAGTVHSAYYFNIPPGNYVFRVKAASSDGVWTEKSIKILITPAWWNTKLFRITAIVCLVALLYGLIRWRLHQKFRVQLERSEKEKQLAELKHKTSELEMQALRSQMNPHFIFNSLNSINRFILQNNKAQASEYLTKFSKLVRMILQNSQASLITLESELEALELYLDLEALRFEHHFVYKISVSNDLDIEVLKVPPLIIQPYAENAIWHGLMHKEEKGRLDIEVMQEDNNLLLKITDDGIGRKQAAELAGKSATRHKSMGLKITADRIALLDKPNGVNSSVSIRDLVNPDGSPGGTEVTIQIQVQYE